MLAAREGMDLESARAHLLDAARRAAVPLAKLAETVIELGAVRDNHP